MTPHRCLFIAVLGLLTFSAGGPAQAPEPAALLRGAEQARRAIRSGILEFTCEQIHHSSGQATSRSARVKIVFDGARRTVHQYQYEFSIAAEPDGGPDHPKVQARVKQFDALANDMDKGVAAGIGTKRYVRRSLAFDGARFCEYGTTPHCNAQYWDKRRATGVVFDPRLLGLAETHEMQEDLSFFFTNVDAKDVQVVSREQVNGIHAYHVQLDVGMSRWHYWIEDSEPFRVHKAEYRGIGKAAGGVTTVISTFPGSTALLPSRVEMRSAWNERLLWESTYAVHDLVLNNPVSSNVGSLASLELPVGTSVIDTTTHKSLGAWDGEGLARDPILAVRAYQQRHGGTSPRPPKDYVPSPPDEEPLPASPARYWPWLLAGAVAGLVGAAVYYGRRHGSRRV
jgi:hypothetical protein